MSEADMTAMLSTDEGKTDGKVLLAYRCARLIGERPKPDSDRAWSRIYNQVIAPERARRVKRRHIIYIYSSAAAMLFAVMIGAYLYINRAEGQGTMMAFVANDAPKEVMLGADKDHLERITDSKRADGAVIDSALADFSHVANPAEEKRVLTTPRGKTYRIVLPDGTEVILNADSKLVFPTRFSGLTRSVKLVGEAYFKVAKDARHPFIVQAEKLSTRVLGTEFNLKAYRGSDCHVTLIEGSVAVNRPGNKPEIVLKPGEDAALRGTGDIDITCVDTEYYVQWKEGFFYFDNLPLVDVVKEIGRWYNINIEIQDNSLMSYRLHFIADRNANVAQVVSNLNAFSYLKAVLKGNKIILSKKTKKADALN